MELEHYVGICMSETQMQIAIQPTQHVFSAACDEQHIQQVLRTLHDVYPILIVLMAEAPHDCLSQRLKKEKLPVITVNEAQATRFAQRMQPPHQSIDAEVLASLGYHIRPKHDFGRTSENVELNALLGRRLQLIEMLMSEKNRLRMSGHLAPAPYASDNINNHVAWLETALEDIDIHLQPFWLIERAANASD